MARRSYQEINNDEERLILDLVRLGLDGEPSSIRHLSRRLLRRSDLRSEAFRAELGRLLVENGGSPLRGAGQVAIPVEPETRQPLAMIERGPREDPPVLNSHVELAVKQIVESWSRAAALVEAGVDPPRTVLLTGPPGVGKSMTARFLATELELPLVGVELAALMSSFLGKTGQNLSRLLDHARKAPCVLFLDEFDAVAKRRDDLTDIGELKRLVNMLLLELDRWPTSSLLVAATNHPQLLDPAVERRFDAIIDLPLPDFEQARAILRRALQRLNFDPQPSEAHIAAVALAFEGATGADLERLVSHAARTSIVSEEPLPVVLARQAMDPLRSEGATRERRAAFAGLASEAGMTQREIAAHLGVTHPTVGRLIRDWRSGAESEDAKSRQQRRRSKKRSQ